MGRARKLPAGGLDRLGAGRAPEATSGGHVPGRVWVVLPPLFASDRSLAPVAVRGAEPFQVGAPDPVRWLESDDHRHYHAPPEGEALVGDGGRGPPTVALIYLRTKAGRPAHARALWLFDGRERVAAHAGKALRIRAGTYAVYADPELERCLARAVDFPAGEGRTERVVVVDR